MLSEHPPFDGKPFFDDVTITEQMSEAQWLAARAGWIGASDAPIICGVSRFESAFSLYHKKVATLEEDPEDAAAREENLYWGRALEVPIINRFGTVHKFPVWLEPKITTHLWRQNPAIVASLDAVAAPVEFGPCVPLEVKNVSAFLADEWEDEVPIYYQVQCQHQMMVTGTDRDYVAALVGGNRFKWGLVERDPAFIDLMLAAELEFLSRLARRQPPEVDGSKETRAFLHRLYPKDTGRLMELPPEAIEWDAEQRRGKQMEKDAGAIIMLAENRLKDALGDASIGTLSNGVQFSWRWQRRAEAVVKGSEFRVLRRSDKHK
jgi:putative phage-type endonuclease